jgi:single-stranded DNA-binding protein
MAFNVTITSAEVIKFYGTEDVLKEFKTEKGGTILSFNIKTRVNDRAENSPVLFEKCSAFAKTDGELQAMKDVLKLGNVVQITGSKERRKYQTKEGKDAYAESVKVNSITPIVIEETQGGSDADLPF